MKCRQSFAATLAIFGALAMSGQAVAQDGPSLEDLAVIEASQGNQQRPAAADPAQDLARDAASQDPSVSGGSYQPAKPDLRYADPAVTERISDQVQGNYGDIDRSTIGMPLGTTQDAWDQPFQNMSQGQSAPGVVRYHWSQDLAMPVRMREFMNTMIVLPDWESVKDVYLGEKYYFESAIVRPNTVALRVKGAGADTNLNIVGKSGNLYTFYLRAEGYNTNKITDMTVFVDAAPINPGNIFKGTQAAGSMALGQAGGQQVDWQTSQQQAAAGPAVNEPEAVSGSNFYIPSLDLKFVHKMFEVHPGDRAIAPEYVATDGRWTYFYYGEKAGMVDRPVIFRLVDGVEERVGTRTIGSKNEIMVAEATGEFVLRNGQKTICIKVATDGTISQ